jgi:hypothetical protein
MRTVKYGDRMVEVPRGVDPGWAYPPGEHAERLRKIAEEKIKQAPPKLAEQAQKEIFGDGQDSQTRGEEAIRQAKERMKAREEAEAKEKEEAEAKARADAAAAAEANAKQAAETAAKLAKAREKAEAERLAKQKENEELAARRAEAETIIREIAKAPDAIALKAKPPTMLGNLDGKVREYAEKTLGEAMKTIGCAIPSGTDLEALLDDALARMPWVTMSPAERKEWLEKERKDTKYAAAVFPLEDQDGKYVPAFIYLHPSFAAECAMEERVHEVLDGYHSYPDGTGDQYFKMTVAHEAAHVLLPYGIYPDVRTEQGFDHGALHRELTEILAERLIPGIRKLNRVKMKWKSKGGS